MKTIITLIISCVAAICIAQNPSTEENGLLSKEQTLEVQETLKKLSDKLQELQKEEAVISNEQMMNLKGKLVDALVKLENSDLVEETFKTIEKSNGNTKIIYSVSANSDGTVDQVNLDNIDFKALGDKLRIVVTELQESPKFKELETKIIRLSKELEEDKN